MNTAATSNSDSSSENNASGSRVQEDYVNNYNAYQKNIQDNDEDAEFHRFQQKALRFESAMQQKEMFFHQYMWKLSN